VKKLIFVIIIIIAALLFYMKVRIDSHSNGSLQFPEFETAEVIRSTISTGITGRGKVQPKRVVNLISSVEGQVKEIHVSEGDVVNKDQCLATIETQPKTQLNLLNLKNRFTKSNMEKKELEKQLEFQKKLYKEGLTTKVDLESVQKKLKWSEENMSALDSELNLLGKQLGRKISRSDLLNDKLSTLTNGCLKSIIDGTILQLNIKVDDYIATQFSANAPPPLVVADLTEYTANYKASEIDLAKIKEGQDVEITLDSWPDKIFSATVQSIGSVVSMDQKDLGPFSNPNQQVSRYSIKIRLTSSGPELRPGLSCTILIRTTMKGDVLVAPLPAVFTADQDEQFVFVKQDKDYNRRKVQVGLSNVDMVEILSGLQQGETVSLVPYKIIEKRKLIRAAQSKSLIEKILN